MVEEPAGQKWCAPKEVQQYLYRTTARPLPTVMNGNDNQQRVLRRGAPNFSEGFFSLKQLVYIYFRSNETATR